jgi:hypothetical protein
MTKKHVDPLDRTVYWGADNDVTGCTKMIMSGCDDVKFRIALRGVRGMD